MKKTIFIFTVLLANIVFLFAQDDDTLIFDKYNNQHIGLFAKDFRFITDKTDDTLSLYGLKADSLIILFYDPDCIHCKREIKKMRKDKKLNKAIELKRVTVLAVPPDITRQEWEKSVKHMPDCWINAWSLDNDIIIKKYLWKVPEKFILDRDKRILDIDMYREDLDDE